MKCKTCGAPGQGEKCTYCGTESTSTVQNQTNMNANTNIDIQVVSIATSNSNSNTNYQNMYIESQRKDKSLALVLCVLFGYFGAHYFYIGKNGMGILYFFTAGLFGIGWFVDIFRIASGSFKDSNGLSLK